jgi:hypothetical protein
MKEDPPGREVVEGGGINVLLEYNDSNKCHFLSSPIESPPVVNDDQADAIGMDVHPDIHGFVDEDLLAAADVNIAVDNVQDAAVDVDLLADVDVVLAVYDDTAAIDHAQVDKDLFADVCINLTKPSKPIQTRPKTSNKFGRGKRRGGNRKSTLMIDTTVSAPQAADMGGVA